MISKKNLQRDLYRLCNASFFREPIRGTNELARLKIMFWLSYDEYISIPLHERISFRGEQYINESERQRTYYDRLYILRFVVDADKFRVQRLKVINENF